MFGCPKDRRPTGPRASSADALRRRGHHGVVPNAALPRVQASHGLLVLPFGDPRARDTVAVLTEQHHLVRGPEELLVEQPRAQRGPVRHADVVPVVDVVDGEFPVAAHAVLLHAVQELHLALRRHEVDAEPSDPTEVVLEWRRRRVERREDEAVVARDLGRRRHPPSPLIEVAPVEDILLRHADERAVEVEAPAVIRAHEALRVADLGPAHLVAPVRAGVEQHTDRAVPPPHGDDLVLADPAREEVAGVRGSGTRGR